MNSEEDFEYRYTVEFPRGQRYSVSTVLDFIPKVLHPCIHHLRTDQISYPAVYRLVDSLNYGGPTKEQSTERRPCEHCTRLQQEVRVRLVEQIRMAARSGHLDLWSWRLGTVTEPPVDGDAFWWAQTADIFRDDLVKFCKSQRLRVQFSETETYEREDSTGQRPKSDHDSAPCEAKSPSDSHEQALSELPPIPCVPAGAIAITKLALQAAWEIELAVGQFAGPDTIFRRLGTWVNTPKDGDGVLIQVTGKAVFWAKTKGGEKEYDLEACSKTLASWHKRRCKNGCGGLRGARPG
ncbi:hypothetical protein [Paraburkholderia sp. DHOC27]|uniref:hypothetical protein n=1 Tax=Paraburkholderia sp. DHOC27 TaxID=2303330 RepID=UPI000E3D01C8|nr:hypothetical protein [Paraburkholderia sp. DHOC27]RFU47340.1 hypothetical protein D0B32_14550 [Paraburkholderia sp. DHOC27]